MRKLALVGITATLIASASIAGLALGADQTGASGRGAASLADPARSAADAAMDANRKPAATIAFIGVKPGDKVVDYMPGGGYFTRLFSDAVGPSGHVYAATPNNVLRFVGPATAALQTYTLAHPNITVTVGAPMEITRYPEKLDVFWIAQQYHDLHDSFMGPVDIAAYNKAVYAALKPGGLYVILDHVAAKGSPADVTNTLHRIEPSTVRREVEAAGFKFVSEGSILANPDDPHTANVFDKSIRGHTDQFIFKFKKPA